MAKDILYQAAAAGVALLNSWAISTVPKSQIYPGIRHETVTQQQTREQSLRKTPRVEVIARKGVPQVPHFKGNWTVLLTFSVVSNSQDTTDGMQRARVEEILVPLLAETIATDLSAATSFFGMAVVVPGDRETEIQDKLWIDSQTLELREACVLDLA
jgi:hypothetical protein